MKKVVLQEPKIDYIVSTKCYGDMIFVGEKHGCLPVMLKRVYLPQDCKYGLVWIPVHVVLKTHSPHNKSGFDDMQTAFDHLMSEGYTVHQFDTASEAFGYISNLFDDDEKE